MKASFNTENVKYELSELGYTRNGHFVQGKVTLKQLTIGKPAILEFELNNFVQVIHTDIVMDIEKCPAFFKMKMSLDVHPYKIRIKRNDKDIISMRIGTEVEIKQWVKERYPKEDVEYKIAPIPVRRKGVS